MANVFDVIIFLLTLVINMVVIVGLLNINKMNPQKMKLAILSLISIVMIAIIPNVGYRVEEEFGYYFIGFPAEMLVYRGDWLMTNSWLGWVFNFFFFYWIFKLIHRLWNGIMKKRAA